MKYYDVHGNCKEIKENELRFLDNGQTANVYHYNDELLKRYFIYAKPELRITDDLFSLLTSIDSSNLVKLHKLYKDEKNETMAYTMDYIEPTTIDFLDYKPSVLLEYLREVERLVDKLTEENVRVMDLKNTNVVTTESGIVIIDPDKYRIVDYKPTTANKDQILYLWYSLLNFGPSIHKDRLDRVGLLNYREYLQTPLPSDVTATISKTLNKNKKMIDIFKKS